MTTHLTRLTAVIFLTQLGCGGGDRVSDATTTIPDVQLFTGARIIVGDGRVVEDGAFIVRDDLIVEVGSSGEIGTPPDAQLVDLSGP